MLEQLRQEYRAWFGRRRDALGRDPMWHMRTYRLARFTADRAWPDVGRLAADPRTREIAAQLSRALGAIPADISEGYSRSSGADRVRFYEYALGSAREARDWYLSAEVVIGQDGALAAATLLNRICRILLSIIPKERKRIVRKPTEE